MARTRRIVRDRRRRVQHERPASGLDDRGERRARLANLAGVHGAHLAIFVLIGALGAGVEGVTCLRDK
jgi:hypothetical protein